MLVTGADKARALGRMLLAPAGSFFPASLLRTHPRLTVICDAAAATELRGIAGGNHVCVVLGHRDPGFSHEHRISRESLGRVQRAEWVAQRKPTRAAVLTGYTSTGGLSEAEQMRAAWRLPGVPSVLEVAGRNTAGNAARSLPIVLALGGIRDVTVVTSAWHVRAPYMFAPWRSHGLRVHFAVDWRGDWPRMLARELQEARVASRERHIGRATGKHERAGAGEDRLGAALRQGCKRRLEVGDGADLDDVKLQPKVLRSHLQVGALGFGFLCVRMDQRADDRCMRRDLSQQVEPFRC